MFGNFKDNLDEPKIVIIALGKNWKEYPPNSIPPNWSLELSLESEITALATGILWHERGCADNIIFSTGKTAGKNWPSEACKMRDYMKEHYPNIPDNLITLEEVSIDTVGNAEEVQKLLPETILQNVILVTVGYHMSRSKKIFNKILRKKGYAVYPVVSEDVLLGSSAQYWDLVEKFQKSRARKIESVKEFILRMILRVDPDGKMLRKITKRLRHAE